MDTVQKRNIRRSTRIRHYCTTLPKFRVRKRKKEHRRPKATGLATGLELFMAEEAMKIVSDLRDAERTEKAAAIYWELIRQLLLLLCECTKATRTPKRFECTPSSWPGLSRSATVTARGQRPQGAGGGVPRPGLLPRFAGSVRQGHPYVPLVFRAP